MGGGTAIRAHGIERIVRAVPHLVLRELRIRYRRTRFGIAWGVLQPLVRFCAMGFVFGAVARLDIERYFEFLLVGILAWTWWSAGVTAATTSVVQQGELVRRPGLPRIVIPLVAVATSLIDLLFALPILLAIVAVSGGLGLPATMLPVLLAIQATWVVGAGLLACASNVYFRDTRPIVETAMMVGFYATPVVFTLELAPGWARGLLGANPLGTIIGNFRAVLLDRQWPGWWDLAWPTATGLVVLAAGLWVFHRTSPNFLDEL